MKKLAKPYQDNVSDYGGSPLDSGTDLVSKTIRNKHYHQDLERIVKRMYTILDHLSGPDRDGYFQKKTIPSLIRSGDIEGMSPSDAGMPNTNYSGYHLKDEIFNKQTIKTGPNHNQPFPYTGSNSISRIYSALELEEFQSQPKIEENIPEITSERPVTQAQVDKKLQELNKEWNYLLESKVQSPIYVKILALLKKMLYDICGLKTQTEFPEVILVDFAFSWIRNKAILMQALKEAGFELWSGDNFENLVTGLSNLYYSLRERQDSAYISKPHAVNYNSRFFY